MSLALAIAVALPARAQQTEAIGADGNSGAPAPEFAAGHGSFSFDYQHVYSHGDYQGPAGADSGNVSFFTYGLDVDYFVADNWEVHVGLPFTSASLHGLYQHPVIPCSITAASCPSVLVDNGFYHGTWADWDAGVRYHADFGGYYVTPSVDLYVPSHNYAFYGSATVGQRVTKLGIGVDLRHQFDFSDIFYDARYQYVFMPHTLGIDANYYTFGVDLGYFVTPKLSLRITTDVKLGNGYTDDQIGANFGEDGTNPIWRLHDKFRLEERAVVGSAADYAINDDYVLSLAVVHSVWGRSNFRLTYGYDVKLSRSF